MNKHEAARCGLFTHHARSKNTGTCARRARMGALNVPDSARTRARIGCLMYHSALALALASRVSAKRRRRKMPESSTPGSRARCLTHKCRLCGSTRSNVCNTHSLCSNIVFSSWFQLQICSSVACCVATCVLNLLCYFRDVPTTHGGWNRRFSVLYMTLRKQPLVFNLTAGLFFCNY